MSVKKFGVSTEIGCPQLIGGSGRSLGRGVNFGCSQSSKPTGSWKFPPSSACSGGTVPRWKKVWAPQVGCTGRSQERVPVPWKPRLSTRSSFLFLCLCQVQFILLQLLSQGKSMALTEVRQRASLPFHFLFLTEVYAPAGNTVSLWIFFQFLKNKSEFWKEISSLHHHIYIFMSAFNDWIEQLCWTVFIVNLTHSRVICKETILIEELPQIVLWQILQEIFLDWWLMWHCLQADGPGLYKSQVKKPKGNE